jgi:hypothetical protein
VADKQANKSPHWSCQQKLKGHQGHRCGCHHTLLHLGIGADIQKQHTISRALLIHTCMHISCCLQCCHNPSLPCAAAPTVASVAHQPTALLHILHTGTGNCGTVLPAR